MPYSAADLDAFLDAFEARPFAVRLNGVLVKTVRGIWRRRTEMVGQGGELVVIPSAQCKESDLDDVTRNCTLTDTTTDIEYRIYGEPVPQNSGFALVGLVKR
jgi:hypothetical protein